MTPFQVKICLILVAIALGLGMASDAFAAATSLDTITQKYQQAAQGWEKSLRNYALSLFWLLAAIEMAYVGIRLALSGADFSEWMAELVNQILFIGFFLALLQNSGDWSRAIVQSFQQAGSSASGTNIATTPSSVFTAGLDLAGEVLNGVSGWSPGNAIALALYALVIIVCFSVIAAFLILALVESYIVISAGVLFMGFGGSRWTKDFALKVITYAVSVGAKLFMLQLIVGVGIAVTQSLPIHKGQQATATASDIFITLGTAVVLLALTKIIPDLVQSLINGTSNADGRALISSAGDIARGTKTATIGTLGSARAIRNAGHLASEQMADAKDNGTAGRTRFGRGIQFSGAMAGNLGRAAMDTISDRLSGRANRHGAPSWQMGSNLFEKAEKLQQDRERAQKPQSQSTHRRGRMMQKEAPLVQDNDPNHTQRPKRRHPLKTKVRRKHRQTSSRPNKPKSTS